MSDYFLDGLELEPIQQDNTAVKPITIIKPGDKVKKKGEYDPKSPYANIANILKYQAGQTAQIIADNTIVPVVKSAIDVVSNPKKYVEKVKDFAGDVADAYTVGTSGRTDDVKFKEGYGKELMDIANVLPLVAGAKKGITLGAKALTKGPLKNVYKYNPKALKENPEAYLYRAQEVGQNPYKNMAAQLREKEAAGEELMWWQKNLLNPQTDPSMIAREKYYGQWFENNPSRLPYYLSEDKILKEGEILRIKLPKSEVSKSNISNFNDAKILSSSPETEFILPKSIIESAEKFSPSSLQKLIQQDKAFNTPHWLMGYKPIKQQSKANTIPFSNNYSGLSDLNKSVLEEAKPLANSYDNIIFSNPLSVSRATNLIEQGRKKEVFADFYEGSLTIDNYVKDYLKDLTSPEGIKRLTNQEADYLRSIGISTRIPEKAELSAFARINEIKNIKNLNKKISDGNYDLDNLITNEKLYNNAFYRPPYVYDYMDDIILNKNIDIKDAAKVFTDPNSYKRVGEKSVPGETVLGSTYKKSKQVAAHEIGGHGLQAGRVLPVDNRLKKELIVDVNSLNKAEAKAYDYFLNGSGGKEPSAFLHELRESMLQAGLIKKRYQRIKPELLERAKTYFKRRPAGVLDQNDFNFLSNTRILDFMDDTKSNYELISRELNKLPALIPGAIGLSALQNKQQGGAIASQKKYRNGGLIGDPPNTTPAQESTRVKPIIMTAPDIVNPSDTRMYDIMIKHYPYGSKSGRQKMLPGHIEAVYSTEDGTNLRWPRINAWSSGNIPVKTESDQNIKDKDIRVSYMKINADQFNKFSKVADTYKGEDYNLLTNNCADGICRALNIIPSEKTLGVTNPKYVMDAINKDPRTYKKINQDKDVGILQGVYNYLFK